MFIERYLRSFKTTAVADSGCKTIQSFPNGWWALAFSEELGPGQVLRTRLWGRDLVVYRTESGRACAIEPYCPHLGTHLGYGGKIEGENIVCPAHRFMFDPDGNCVGNMYGTLPARTTMTTALATVERNGFIFVWQHSEQQDPDWELPEVFDNSPADGTFTIRLSDHPQEVIENIVDWGHFLPVHGYEVVGARDSIVFSDFQLTASLVSVKHLPFEKNLRFNLRHTNFGVGCFSLDMVEFAPLRAKLFMRIALTPEELRSTVWRARVGFQILAPDTSNWIKRAVCTLVSRLLYRPAVALMLLNLRNDGPIWGHKAYLETPGLAKGDGPIGPYRKWVKRFYSIPSSGFLGERSETPGDLLGPGRSPESPTMHEGKNW